MKIAKENNQYYGRYIERGIADLSAGKSIQNYENFNFSSQELAEMNKDITTIVEYLHSNNIQYIGNHTANANGDLIVDNQIVEIKYTDGSMGTYFNTSVEYVKELGYISYIDYLKQHNYYDKLEELGITPNRDNKSPVSIEMSKIIRQNKPIYELIQHYEKGLRDNYVEQLFHFLSTNEEKRLQFVKDLITKRASNKMVPDRLIVFNHDEKWLREYKKNDIVSIANGENFSFKGSTIKISKAHFTFAWQNGTGLNNPTIRVFLEG